MSDRRRSVAQTTWLQRHALQSGASGTTNVFVVTQPSDAQVVAYYAWCIAQIDVAAALHRLRKGASRNPQPIALLARVADEEGMNGEGLGAGFLVDVIARLLGLTDSIGCRGLGIHAETNEARRFQLHLLLLKDARREPCSGRAERGDRVRVPHGHSSRGRYDAALQGS